MAAPNDQIVTAIEGEFASFPGTGGVAAKHLGTGEEIRIGADLQTATASTIKVPILIELYRQIEVGNVSLSDRLAVTKATQTVGSGILRDLSLGVELSVRDLAMMMIVISDNTATNMLIDLVGLDRVNQTMNEFGFSATELRERLDFAKIGEEARNLAVSTPSDLAGIMEALATGTILNDTSRAEILDILRHQHHLNLVPRYLPHDPYTKDWGEEGNGLQIANKTGGWTGMRADMALVEWSGTQYVVSIVIEGDPDTRFWAENQGDRLVGRISKLVFDYFGGAEVPPLKSRPDKALITSG